MALKARITKADFDALPEHFRGEYKRAREGDGYVLDIDGETEEFLGMRRAKEQEKEESAKAKKELAELRTRLETTESEWTSRYATLEKSVETKREAYRSSIAARERESAAAELAGELFGKNAKLGVPHLKERFAVEFDENDKPTVKIVGSDGKAIERDALKKEFSTNPDFASILVATGASGAGTSPNARGRAPVGANNTTPKRISELQTPEEKAAWVRDFQARQQQNSEN